MMRIVAMATAVLFLAAALPVAAAFNTEKVPRMSKEELRPLIGNPSVVILDVRQPGDYDKSEAKIKGAVRVNPKEKIGDLMDRIPKDKTLVFYCS